MMLRSILITATLAIMAVVAQPVSAHWYRHAHPTMWAQVPHGVEHKHYNHRERYSIKNHRAQRHATRKHKNFWRKMKSYRFPKVGHYRVDYCYKKNRFCGRTAANAFCKMHGFKYASQFKIDRHALKTKHLGDHRISRYPQYHGNGFTYVRCRKH